MNKRELYELSQNLPVVVDFWATWCEPCFMLEPILEELAKENEGRWQLVKIDTDQNKELADALHIRSVPTTCLFVNGEEVGRYNGLMWKKEFGEWIDSLLTVL